MTSSMIRSMSWSFYLTVYAVIFSIALTAGLVFYIREYMARGGQRLQAVWGALRLALFFYPLPLVVFFHANQIAWPNVFIWRLYGLVLVAYIFTVLLSRKYRDGWHALRQATQAWPFVSSVLLITIFIFTAPALVVLCLYVLE